MNDAIYQRAINSLEFRTARNFCEDGGENEYVRACAEMVCDLTGTPMDYKEAIMAALIAPPKPQDNNSDKPESVVALEGLIREVLAPDMGERTFNVNIYTFGSGDGIRVAEASYWIPRKDNPLLGAGGSWMRSDMQSGQVILACEQFLLCYGDEPKIHDGWVGDLYDPTFQDDEQEAAQAVRAAVSEGEDRRPWVNRWPAGREAPQGGTVKWYDPEKKAAYDEAMTRQGA